MRSREGGVESLNRDYTWVVDPIDGTSPFLHGLQAWCISIALVHNNQLVLGLIYDPLHKELFHAARNQGAYLNSQPISTLTNAENLSDGLIGMGISHRISPDHFTATLQQLLLQGGMFVRNGSGALTLAYVAAGRLLGYFEPHMNSWDSAAGMLLVQEAGGKCNDVLLNDGLHKGSCVLAMANSTIYQKFIQLNPTLTILR